MRRSLTQALSRLTGGYFLQGSLGPNETTVEVAPDSSAPAVDSWSCGDLGAPVSVDCEGESQLALPTRSTGISERSETSGLGVATAIERLHGKPSAVAEEILAGADLVELLSVGLDGRSAVGQRQRLLTTLSELVPYLSISVRIKVLMAMIDAPQCFVTFLAKSIILSASGDDLTLLKAALGGRDPQCMMTLVYDMLGDEQSVASILEHLRIEGQRVSQRPRCVVSDIDDTIFAHWKDAGCPGRYAYPGVRQFYRELSSPDNESRALWPVFITARPTVYFSVTEDWTRNALQNHGFEKAVLLTGDLLHVFPESRITSKKVENFEKYSALYPECDFVFLGDNGQRDPEVAERLLVEHGDVVKASFIHVVQPCSNDVRLHARKRSTFYFDSYIGAAREALRASLISKEAARRVVSQAFKDFQEIDFDSKEQRDTLFASLQRDKRWLDDVILRSNECTLGDDIADQMAA